MKPKRKGLTLAQRDYVAGYLFVAPILILMGIWFYYPVVKSLTLSFQDVNFLNIDNAEFVGFGNFKELFADASFRQAARNTVVITAVCVPVLLVLSFIVAYKIENLLRGKGIYRTLYYIPAVTSAVAMTTSVMYLFVERGVIPTLFHKLFGLPNVTWPADTRLALSFVCILVIWKNLGFFVVMFITGLKSVSSEILEAAEVDGASKRQKLIYIIIPQLRPTTILVLSLSTIWCMQCFDEPFTLAKLGAVVGSPAGTTSTVVTFFYSQNFRFFRPGYGSAAAFVIFIVLMGVSILQNVAINRSKEDA